MHLLYPSDPFDKNAPDQDYEEEYAAALAAGFTCYLFSAEEFELNNFNLGKCARQARAAFQGDVLYRGWMLTSERYGDLYRAVEAKGARLLVNPQAYRHCHHLPEWYGRCAEFTPQTLFLSRDADFGASLARTGWNAYFVKDYVKCLTTSRGSVARNPAEVGEIVQLIEHYRGQIEGGVCVRELEDLLPETEERYFVLHGQAHGREHTVPAIVQTIAGRIDSPFFSVDILMNRIGQPRLIELGDGQVSDRKRWPAERFVGMLSSRASDAAPA